MCSTYLAMNKMSAAKERKGCKELLLVQGKWLLAMAIGKPGEGFLF